MAEAASALATELLRCEGRKTTGEGWAGPHSAGPAQELGRLWWAARVRPGNFLLSLSFISISVLFSFI